MRSAASRCGRTGQRASHARPRRCTASGATPRRSRRTTPASLSSPPIRRSCRRTHARRARAAASGGERVGRASDSAPPPSQGSADVREKLTAAKALFDAAVQGATDRVNSALAIGVHPDGFVTEDGTTALMMAAKVPPPCRLPAPCAAATGPPSHPYPPRCCPRPRLPRRTRPQRSRPPWPPLVAARQRRGSPAAAVEGRQGRRAQPRRRHGGVAREEGRARSRRQAATGRERRAPPQRLPPQRLPRGAPGKRLAAWRLACVGPSAVTPTPRRPCPATPTVGRARWAQALRSPPLSSRRPRVSRRRRWRRRRR